MNFIINDSFPFISYVADLAFFMLIYKMEEARRLRMSIFLKEWWYGTQSEFKSFYLICVNDSKTDEREFKMPGKA